MSSSFSRGWSDCSRWWLAAFLMAESTSCSLYPLISRCCFNSFVLSSCSSGGTDSMKDVMMVMEVRMVPRRKQFALNEGKSFLRNDPEHMVTPEQLVKIF